METILFLIIAGILSSIFGKAKSKNTQGRTKPFTAKGFDEFRTRVEKQMGSRQRNIGEISTGQPAAQEQNLQNIKEKYQEIKTNPVVPIIPADPKMKEKDTSRIVVETDDMPFEKPDEKTIINGIVWAEILGEPRAKKPYCSKKF